MKHRGPPCGRRGSKHSPESSDRSLCSSDESASHIYRARPHVTRSKTSDDGSLDRSSPSSRSCQSAFAPSEVDESDPDTTRVGADDQRHSDRASSSSGELILCLSSTHLLLTLCEKLIGSLEDMWSHINEPPTDRISNQGPTGHIDSRDLTIYTAIQDPTNPINALNIQELVLADIIKAEVLELNSVLKDLHEVSMD